MSFQSPSKQTVQTVRRRDLPRLITEEEFRAKLERLLEWLSRVVGTL